MLLDRLSTGWWSPCSTRPAGAAGRLRTAPAPTKSARDAREEPQYAQSQGCALKDNQLRMKSRTGRRWGDAACCVGRRWLLAALEPPAAAVGECNNAKYM